LTKQEYFMASAYLYFNAALYLLFALWCTVAPLSTAANLGYASLTRGGHCEYLVIYGGVQVGLALLFCLLARDSTTVRLGLLVSIALYAPIVFYRGITVLRFWPVSSMTIGTDSRNRVTRGWNRVVVCAAVCAITGLTRDRAVIPRGACVIPTHSATQLDRTD
jgi:hypothetical protein